MLPPVPGSETLLEMWLGRSNRSRAGLAGSWTTRAQCSPRPSRSYRRPETESLPVTELTGFNLRHARPGAGRALVGNGETGRAQSQRIQPVTGIAHRQEDRWVRLQNRVVSTTARRALHTLSRNEKFEFFWCPFPWGSECSGNYQPRGNGKTARGIDSADPSRLQPPRNGKPAGDVARQIEPLPSRSRRCLDYENRS